MVQAFLIWPQSVTSHLEQTWWHAPLNFGLDDLQSCVSKDRSKLVVGPAGVNIELTRASDR